MWDRHENLTFRHYHAMQYMLPATLERLYKHDQQTLFNPEFFETRTSKNLDAQFVQVKPIAQFPNNEVDLGYQVGTRGNGVDYPTWPKDLLVEVVTGDN